MIGKFDKSLPKKVKRGLMAIKLLLASLAVTEFAMQNNGHLGFYLLISAGVLDILVEVFYGEDKKEQ